MKSGSDINSVELLVQQKIQLKVTIEGYSKQKHQTDFREGIVKKAFFSS